MKNLARQIGTDWASWDTDSQQRETRAIHERVKQQRNQERREAEADR